MGTIREALDEDLNRLVKDVDGLLERRGLSGASVCTPEVYGTAAYQLAYAGGLFRVLISPNVTQGDWSRSWGDRSSLERIISNIYARYAPEENPLPGVLSVLTDVTDRH